MAKERGERSVQAEILTSLARGAAALGKREAAERYLDEGLRLAWEVAYIGLILQTLLTRGEFLGGQGEAFEAAKLAFLVHHHPAATDVERAGVAALLAGLETDLTAERLELAEAFGRDTPLERALEALLEAPFSTGDYSTHS